eukprot:tig00020616_g12304.t1
MEHAHYCFKCRSNTKLANVEVRTSKNNRQVAVGSCTQCSGRVSRFMRRVLEEGARETSPPPQRPQVTDAAGPAAGSSQAPAAPTAPKPPAAPRQKAKAAPRRATRARSRPSPSASARRGRRRASLRFFSSDSAAQLPLPLLRLRLPPTCFPGHLQFGHEISVARVGGRARLVCRRCARGLFADFRRIRDRELTGSISKSLPKLRNGLPAVR